MNPNQLREDSIMASKTQAIINYLSNNPDANEKDAEAALKSKLGKYSSSLFYSAKRAINEGKGKATNGASTTKVTASKPKSPSVATAAKPSSNGQALSSFKVVTAVEKAKALLQSVSKEEAKALIDAL
jgi:hypothetical protein